MTDAPYTQKRREQYRGPQSSEDYNLRNEEAYKDLAYLINKSMRTSGDLDKGFAVFSKDFMGLAHAFQELKNRVTALEGAANTLSFATADQIDTDRFNSIGLYAVSAADRCTYHNGYGITTLPQVTEGSMSKIRFINADGTYNIPATMETYVSPNPASADSGSAVVDTSQPYNAIAGKPGRVWERNVIAASPNSNGADMYFYVRIPNDLSAVADTNTIQFTPYPLNSVDVLEVSYSTDPNIVLGSGATWTQFNAGLNYYNAPGAAGNVIPGAWANDYALSAGSKKFYFDPKPITAVRFRLRQRNYISESSKYVYSYGMSKLDIRYDKFLDSGSVIVRFNAPAGDTISKVNSLTPYMWNVPEYSIGDVFKYQVIWETSFNSGNYTTTPVPSSQRVWVKITLNKMTGGGTPALAGLVLKYS